MRDPAISTSPRCRIRPIHRYPTGPKRRICWKPPRISHTCALPTRSGRLAVRVSRACGNPDFQIPKPQAALPNPDLLTSCTENSFKGAVIPHKRRSRADAGPGNVHQRPPPDPGSPQAASGMTPEICGTKIFCPADQIPMPVSPLRLSREGSGGHRPSNDRRRSAWRSASVCPAPLYCGPDGRRQARCGSGDVKPERPGVTVTSARSARR